MHRERLSSQLLSGTKAVGAEDAVRHLLAVQGQDPRGFRLAVRARTTETTVAEVDAALSDRRSLVVSWLNRGTLHLVAAEDYWWLHPLTTPQLATGNATRLRQEGVSAKQADRGVAIICDEVATKGPRTRAELRDALDAAGVPTAEAALVHLLFAATLRADLIRGPMRGKDHCFVSALDWLGPAPAPLERSDALARLARRYLRGHGPATARDLARWAGITLSDARRGLAAITDEVSEREDGLLDLVTRPPASAMPPPSLLGAYDPVLCGWESRAFITGDHRGIVTTNGLFRPFALVDGRAVATWGLDGGVVTMRLLEPVTDRKLRALRADAADVLRYLGLPALEPVVVPPPN